MDTFSVREIYDYIQVELNKAKAPSITLEDFLYFLNKAVNNYCNIKYNTYNINQQFTDDLKELVRTYSISEPKIKDGNDVVMQNNSITPTPVEEIPEASSGKDIDYAVVTIKLPDDYYHLLGCSIKYKKTEKPSTSKRCPYNSIKTNTPYKVRRVTTDSLTTTLNNYYYKPKLNSPYFILNNETFTESSGSKVSTTVEIHVGKIPEIYTVDKVSMVYFVNPKKLSMSEDDLYTDEDNTEKMQFSRYICYEIINILIGLIMINSGNPLVSSVTSFNKTISPINIQDTQVNSLQE